MPWTIQLDLPENNHRTIKHVKRKVHEAFTINRLKTLNETDKTFKSTKQRERERVVTTTSPQTVANTFPENRKPLNCNFGVRFYVNLKTTFSKLS